MMRRKALILGERAIAGIIARQLEEEGIEPFFQSAWVQDPLPSLGDVHCFDKMRSLLKSFAQFCQQSGTQAQLIHPGATPWAERPELNSLCQELGLGLIGPPARVLSAFSDKLNFLIEAEKIGIPNLVLNSDPMHTVREIDVFIQETRFTFPFVVKAVKGGGSSGIRVVQDSQSLLRDLPLWFDQLRHFQGEVLFFLEKYLEGARHIVVPFVRFREGRKVIFPTMDASLQCRYRKVVEFCPAVQIDRKVHHQLVAWVETLADYYGYVGVGSFEFLVDGPRAFLIDGTPRLNTDFQLWNRVAKTRAVSWQLAALQSTAPGISMLPEEQWSSGVSARIYAEDSLIHLPQPGVIGDQSSRRSWRDLQAELMMNYSPGDSVSPFDSGLLGQFILESSDRRILCSNALEVLKEIWIAGSLQTNERFLFELLGHLWVREEMFHAGFVDEEFFPVMKPSPEMIFLLKSVCVLGEENNSISGPKDSFISGVALLNDQRVFLSAFPLGSRWIARVDRWTMTLRRGSEIKNRQALSALTSGRVHSILFRVGIAARAHETLIIVESLGVFIPHALPVPVRVTEWGVAQGDCVHLGQMLALIEI